jgi:hypothetical protein
MPSFIIANNGAEQESCRVYFSLSNFNKLDDVRNNVQVVVNDKNTNQSVLNPTLYPAGIKITNIQEDRVNDTDMRYYITIHPDDLKEGFEINRFYKVQIRFTHKSATPLKPEIVAWLLENQSSFSEWSSVCLIRGISTPQLTLRNFEEANSNKELIFTSETIQLTGNIQFNNPNGELAEFVDSIKVKLFKKDDGENNASSYTVPIQQNTLSSINEFNYTFKEIPEDGVTYIIKFTYITNGGYSKSNYYTFKVIKYGIDKINATILATAENSEGRIKIDIKALENIKEDFVGKITIRRTSSESNFTEWEDVHNALLTESKELDYTWYDYTITSGIWYKYCVQKRNRRNDRGVVVQTKEPVMAYFEDSFLVHGGRQLKLKFDSTVSSFKYNVLESRTDTLGSQYPFIRRNGHTKYRTFPITGLITSFCDEEGLFTTKKDIYNNTLELYERYNINNDINEYRDFSYEREFRERVIDFLYENNIKLFKSPTEGNILVRLMDINLTPNQTLGRMLYSFSAVAYEMDKANIDTYNTYNIQILEKLEEGLLQQTEDRFGAITIVNNYFPTQKYFKVKDPFDNFSDNIYCPSNNIIDLLDILNANKGALGFDNKIKKIKYLKLVFTSKPWFIKEYNHTLSFMDNKSEIEPGASVFVGYWIQLNNKDIVIKANPQYKLKERQYDSKKMENGFAQRIVTEYATYEVDDTDVSSLILKTPTTSSTSEVYISYIAENTQIENPGNLIDKLYYDRKVGQLEGPFGVNKSLMRELRIKYNEEYDTGYTELVSVEGISIDAPQGTVLLVKDSLDTHYNQHEINYTGYLDLNNDLTTLEDFQFSGIRLIRAPYQDNYPELIRDRTDFLYKHPLYSESIDKRIEDMEYINQYYSYEVVNNKIIVHRHHIESFPDNPVKNGVYIYGTPIGEDEHHNTIYNFEYYIYYHDHWYIFDPVEEVVKCPIDGLVNYYCEVVEGEYEIFD